MATHHTRLAVLALGALAFSPISCDCNGDGGGDSPPPPPVCTDPAIDPARSIVVNDVAGLRDRFSLRKTLQSMVDSSGGGGTPEALLQSMLDSFAASSFTNKDGKQVPVMPAPGEAGLSVSQLLDPSVAGGLVPTGLFNRFDLAPKSGEHCGEYRITYARTQGAAPGGRFLLIFEAALPNPNPAQGLAGCKPITDFWTALSSENNSAARLDQLEKFYYTGVSAAAPVVRYANYGVPLGQVRSNLFINGVLWRLREHRANPVVAGGATFVPDTVQQSPLAAMYRTTPPPGGFTAADKQAFRDDFLAVEVCSLTPDRANAGATQAEVVNAMGSDFPDTLNDFESISQGTEDDPENGTEGAFSIAIGAQLSTLSPGTGLTAADVVNRAGAMSCGGCHQFSNLKPIGNGKAWPNSGGFVHIDESGTLSPALSGVFVPRRTEILTKFHCNPTATAPALCPTARAAAAEAAPVAELLKAAEDARLRYVTALSQPAREAGRVDALAKEVSAAVEAARSAERELPGAFETRRRTH